MISPRTPRLLVAGATGYIGGGVLEAAKNAGLWVRALARERGRLHHEVDDVFVGHATRPETLAGLCDGIDVVFSSIGIHSYAASPTLWEVDYRANMNILAEAKRAGVKHFAFITVVHCEDMAKLSPIAKARLEVARAIQESGLGYTIYEPTGFFNDMEELLAFAAKWGIVPLFGGGEGVINPLSALDLGEELVAKLAANDFSSEVTPVGGPRVMTHREAAELAFRALERPARITSVPAKGFAWAARAIEPFNYNVYALLKFFEYCSITDDMCGKAIGRRTLGAFYRNRVAGMSLREADARAVSSTPSIAPPRAA